MAVVGRRQELADVRAALDSRDTVTVTGEAGMGKTTLVARAVIDLPHAVGGGLPSLHWSAVFPFEAAVRERLNGPPDDVADRVAHLLGRRILVLEDLHWTHPSVTQILELLVGRVPIVATARVGELAPAQRRWVDAHAITDLGPLGAGDAKKVVKSRWPTLSDAIVEQTIVLAAGNPLLLGMLPRSDDEVSPSLDIALRHRLGTLSRSQLDALGKLALLGRPAPAHLIDADASSGLVVVDGTTARFSHPHLASLVTDLLEQDAVRLHRELARSLPEDEAAEHHLLGAEYERALELATAAARKATSSVDRARQLRLAVTAAERLGRRLDGVRLAAADALIDAHQVDDAIEVANGVGTTEPAHSAHAALLLGRAHWLAGDLDAARCSFATACELFGGAGGELAVRAHLERTNLAVRHGAPDALELAGRAVALAEESGVEVARARALLGAALLYGQDPSWESVLSGVMETASAAADLELELLAGWHYTSGLGFTGRIDAARALDASMARRAGAGGFRSWQTHYESAWLANTSMAGGGQVDIVITAQRIMAERPSFRNWPQVMAALALALADLGRTEEARTTSEALTTRAATTEERVWAAYIGAELGWLSADREQIDANLELGRGQGDAWFGSRILCELAALHHAIELGTSIEPVPPTALIPTLCPALHELEAVLAWRSGDAVAGARLLGKASDGWTVHGARRLAARARFSQSLLLERGGRGRGGARRRAITMARTCGLGGHLAHWGAPAVDAVTSREAEVLERVGAGWTSPQIARQLGLAVGTVDDHVRSARRKLGVRSRMEAALALQATNSR